MELLATPTHDVTGFELIPAAPQRGWMDETHVRFAYRCLPLSMANQSGWAVSCPLDFEAVWDGGGPEGVIFTSPDAAAAERYAPYIGSRYGHGIVSIQIPYTFRTSPGYGLLVRGPANGYVMGAHPLDLFLDSSQGDTAFTLDWRLEQPGRPAAFAKGQPLCQLVPYPLDLLEALQPKFLPIGSDPGLQERFARWFESRNAFLDRRDRTDEEWQKDYFLGKDQGGEKVSGHKTRLSLCPFHQASAPD